MRPLHYVFLAVIVGCALWATTGLANQTHPQSSPSVPAHTSTAAESGSSSSPSHTTDHPPVGPVLVGLVIILAAAKVGGEVAERFRQPAVLGELIIGVAVGNLGLIGIHSLGFLVHNPSIYVLSEIGVVILLFEVGLESNVSEMLSVGPSSFLVATLGVIAPFFLGWGLSAWMLPKEPTLAHIFIGATLCATSVGITARVLTDLGKVATREAKIILGAAVIDDVLGLVILAVVAGLITAADTGRHLQSLDILWIVAKATLFMVGAIGIGSWVSPRLFHLASHLRIKGMLLTVSLLFCFFLSYLANVIGLAPIVGAFAAGMILDEVHYKDFLDRGEHELGDLIHPISIFLVPIFFIHMGLRVDLATFGHSEVLDFALLLSLAAMIGKGICAAGVLERGLDRLSVAVGMIPRGEVGLIFAGIGSTMLIQGERVIVPSVYSAVVIMVILTTVITPPILKVTLARGDRKKAARAQRQAEKVAQ